MHSRISTLQIREYGGIDGLPGYEMFEYQLVLAIPETFREKIRKTRRQFSELYGNFSNPEGAILLPLVKFKQRNLLEERLRHSLHTVIMGWQPFIIHLKDFAAQPAHSIFIPVGNKNDVQQRIKELKNIQSMMKPDKEHLPFFFQEHRFVVASKLTQGVFEKSWQQYSQRHFTAQFIAEACLLLKRKNAGLPWQIAQRIEMKNLPSGVKQATLFG